MGLGCDNGSWRVVSSSLLHLLLSNNSISVPDCCPCLDLWIYRVYGIPSKSANLNFITTWEPFCFFFSVAEATLREIVGRLSYSRVLCILGGTGGYKRPSRCKLPIGITPVLRILIFFFFFLFFFFTCGGFQSATVARALLFLVTDPFNQRGREFID